MQQEAYSDFQKGAELGNSVAKEAVVRENPYAKLCNAMVAEAMRSLK